MMRRDCNRLTKNNNPLKIDNMKAVYEHMTIQKFKEVRSTFKKIQMKYERELKLWASPEQREFNQMYVNHYNKEIAKIDAKIATFPFI